MSLFDVCGYEYKIFFFCIILLHNNTTNIYFCIKIKQYFSFICVCLFGCAFKKKKIEAWLLKFKKIITQYLLSKIKTMMMTTTKKKSKKIINIF